MRPKTSVRQPVIAGARRQHLADMLRKWRRQPRKRSLLLFWMLLSLALMSDSGVLLFGTRLVGVSESPTSPPTERHIHVPYAADAALWEPLRHWVVRVDGRTQLFESFCRKAVREITGDERFEGCDPLAVVVSWMLLDNVAESLKWDDYPCLRCEDAELRDLLYSEGRSPSRMSREEQLHGRYVEPSVVSSSPSFREVLHRARIKGRNIPLSSLERKAIALQDRLKLFQQIRRGSIVDGWNSAEMQTASAELREEYQSGSSDWFAAALTDFLDASRRAMRLDDNPREARRVASEVWLNEHAPARKAMFLSLLGGGLFAAAAIMRTRWPRWRRRALLAGLLACLGGLSWSSSAIFCQSIRDGVPPLSDGTQGVLWCASLVMGLGLFLALLGRDTFLGLTGALASSGGLLLANHWPPAFAEHWPPLPQGIAGDPWLRLQVLLLWSAYAALALAWAVAALALGRILLASPTGERVRGLAALCVGPLRLGVMLLAASALLDACRAIGQGAAWRGWNAQTVGTLLVLPGCAALVYARRRGWIQPFHLMAGVVFGFTFLAMMWHTANCAGIGKQIIAAAHTGERWFYAAGFLNLSLAAHAALRYYFGRQRILEA
jgi:hypothetical protein